MVCGVSHLRVFSSKEFEVYLMYPKFKFEFKHPNVQKMQYMQAPKKIDDTTGTVWPSFKVPYLFKKLSGAFLHLARGRDLTKNSLLVQALRTLI
jgi:hypothetical protein